MTPACSVPERREWRQKISNLLARILASEKRFKILVAVGQVAALIVLIVRSCS
jgi:hypothetical protein